MEKSIPYELSTQYRMWRIKLDMAKTMQEKLDLMSEYYKTPEWRYRRNKCLEAEGYCCHICGSRDNLKVHHKTYAHIGYEFENDLVALCDTCHKRLHAAMEIERSSGCEAEEQLVEEIADVVTPVLAKHRMNAAKRAAHYMLEVPLNGRTAQGARIAGVYRSVIRKRAYSIVIKFEDGTEHEIYGRPDGARDEQLVRILRGKEKSGMPNTVEEWEKTWEV